MHLASSIYISFGSVYVAVSVNPFHTSTFWKKMVSFSLFILINSQNIVNEYAWALTALPRRALLNCQCSCPKDGKWYHDITPWHHVMSWHHMTWDSEPEQVNPSENHILQLGDLDLWPMNFTFKLIRDIVKVNPSTKFLVGTSNGSARRVLTNRQGGLDGVGGAVIGGAPIKTLLIL